MRETFPRHQGSLRIDWSKVGTELVVSEYSADIFATLSGIFNICALKLFQEKRTLSARARDILAKLLTEEVSDLTQALALDSTKLFFSVTFDMPPEVGGRAESYRDGNFALVFNGHHLIQTVESLDALFHELDAPSPDDQAVKKVLLPQVCSLVAAVAHELGHIRQLQQFTGLARSSQSWDINTSIEAVTEAEIASYIHHPLETNAVAVSVRYLREKARVGSPLWRLLSQGATFEIELENILTSGAILDLLKLEGIMARVKDAQIHGEYELAGELLKRVGTIIARGERLDDRTESLRDRLKELSEGAPTGNRTWI